MILFAHNRTFFHSYSELLSTKFSDLGERERYRICEYATVVARGDSRARRVTLFRRRDVNVDVDYVA